MTGAMIDKNELISEEKVLTNEEQKEDRAQVNTLRKCSALSNLELQERARAISA
jgi:hypothetical protein